MHASELPFRVYTTADGLPHDDVYCIRRDSRGYMWFGTADGLSIFDGYQFSNYTTADGLPDREVSAILETRRGDYWVATGAGLCRFDPRGKPGSRFVAYHPTQGRAAEINWMVERADGSIWLSTEAGVWRMKADASPPTAERVPLPTSQGDLLAVRSMVEDRLGTLWVASGDGLFAIERDGRTSRIGMAEGLPDTYVRAVAEGRQGRIWVITAPAICEISAGAEHAPHKVLRCFRGWPANQLLTGLFASADGKLWNSSYGIRQFDPDAPAGPRRFNRVATELPGILNTGPLGEDADGNIWAAGWGAMKVVRHGFSTFSSADGLRSVRVNSIGEDRNGRIRVTTDRDGSTTVHLFDGFKFDSVDPRLPSGIKIAWGESQITFQDHIGDWWVPTANGLLRYASPARFSDLATATPKQVFTTRDGLTDDFVLRLFEDSRGDIWIGLSRGLARWDRKTGRIHSFGPGDNLPLWNERSPYLGSPEFIAEDARGAVWVGFYPSGVARFDGRRFRSFSEADGVPRGKITWIYRDHRDRLWIASNRGGAARVDDVAAVKPVFVPYTVAEGLATNQISTIVEDGAGQLYLGGGRGVDRLDPATGHVHHFGAADGLPPGRVQYAFRDGAGAIWFGSAQGLSRYVPQPEPESPPRSPVIRRLGIAGKESAVAELGEDRISGVRLGPAQTNLRIEFSSLHFRSGEVLRYQYKLAGADSDWSQPSEQRVVNYANLAPGTYEFAVRAMNGDGLISQRAATVEFVVVPPFWRRPSSIALEIAASAALVLVAHRYRLKRALEMERIRTRLASDLHDDIGSGLAEIAILSEVAAAQPGEASRFATEAGARARRLRGSMSDIVWSVDTRHTSLAELATRIRQSANSMLESDGTAVEFKGPEEGDDTELPPDLAREALLISREALTNIARHANASEVFVKLAIERDGRGDAVLVFGARDNGRGFDAGSEYGGMGLRSLRRRAAHAKGTLTIDSGPGKGARIEARLPLR